MSNKNSGHPPVFLFDKTNYILMAAGVIVMGIGFLLMLGGYTEDPNVFNPEEIYSFRRITLAPIVIIIGIVIEFVAVLRRPKD